MLIYRKKKNEKEIIEYGSLAEALEIDKYLPGAVISIVGAGGKTTTTLNLASELSGIAKDFLQNMAEHKDSESGRVETGFSERIFVTTTTHMLREPGCGFMMDDGTLKAGFDAQMRWCEALPWDEHEYLVLGADAHSSKHGDKLCSFPDDLREKLEKECFATVIEADGARMLPFKIPGENEPVIPEETDIVLVVMGLSAIGKPIMEIAFRSELMADFLGCTEDDILTVEYAVRVLWDSFGKKIKETNPDSKTVYVINQADTDEDVEAAGKIAELLTDEDVIITSYRIDSNRTDLCTGKNCPTESHIEGEYYFNRSVGNNDTKFGLVMLAAGFGKRYGSNKLLADFNGKKLYSITLEKLQKLAKRKDVCSLVVVTQYDEIIKDLEKSGIDYIVNDHAEDGISSSLILGVEKTLDISKPYSKPDAFMFFVADQPYMKYETYEGMMEEYKKVNRTDQMTEEHKKKNKTDQMTEKDKKKNQKDGIIMTAGSDNRRGNPVIFDGCYTSELLSLTGDEGGRQILKKYPDMVISYEVYAEELVDIDVRVNG